MMPPIINVSTKICRSGLVPGAYVGRGGDGEGVSISMHRPKSTLAIAGQSENGSENGIRRDRDEVRHKI
jgi:hypothetical protein